MPILLCAATLSMLCSRHAPPCSSCRAVWYCGTACSHALLEHRCVCKVLGAERQARKQAAAAAAAEQQRRHGEEQGG